MYGKSKKKKSYVGAAVAITLSNDDKVRVNIRDAKRGMIYDAYGRVLACDGKGASAGIVPGKLSEISKDEDFQKLSELLEVSVEYIEEQLGAAWVSDNIYFAKQALAMGNTVFSKGLDILGFGEELPFTVGLAASSYGSLDTTTDEILIANSGYGQGEILVNPLHLVSIYSAFLNDGDMLLPVLVQSDFQTKVWKADVFSETAAGTVAEALEMVVKEDTGTQA